jgi:methyl-accepting chemotaxis protein-1 (serine sensor receptor)
MDKLKVSTRLLLLAGSLGLLLLLIGALGLYGIDRSNQALRTVYEDRTVPATQLGEINSLVLQNRVKVNAAILTPTPDVIKTRTEEIEANIARAGKVWSEYTSTYLTPEEARLAKDFAEKRAEFVEDALKPIITALRAGNVDGAKGLLESKLRKLAPPLEEGIATLVKLQVDVARQEYEAAQARYHTFRLLAVGLSVLGIAFAAVFGLLTVRSIGRQLGGEPHQAADIARRVAAGDLSQSIALRAGDQSSVMAQLKAMQEGLAGVVHAVRGNAESVATASAQIAQGNSDLSGRTEEQASALEETASSMEQLAATVKQNADNARQADQLARGAHGVAARGGTVVGEVVEMMNGINESSRQISEIIAVIDGIAFQTNILALNAAVEAARAGEQGRGFAVVAGEVRTLAQRSAEAAKQVKSLITASAERVEAGCALVDQAGATMREIEGSVRRVTDIIAEISAASGEQSAGVSQIGEAVMQMDHATQQNAALVEDSAAAAESLKAQARQLVHAVAAFRLAL